MIDHHALGGLLLETGRISRDEHAASMRKAKATGRPMHEILLQDGKISVDELVQAIIIHMDITLLKEALGMEQTAILSDDASRPLGSYLERISLLFKVGMLMSGQKNVAALIDLLIREAPSVVHAERATIFLADHEKKQLFSHTGVGVRLDEIRIPWSSGIAGWVFTNGKPLNIVDAYQDPRFNRDVDDSTGFRTRNLLCVPMQAPGGPVIGVFQVLNKRAGVFTSTDLEILNILGSQAARSMENAMEWDHLRKSASHLKEENVGLRQALKQTSPLDEIVGASPEMQDVRALVMKVAPTETAVLIQGESGTGKELVARGLHSYSKRADGKLIVLNCAAVPSELIESELFGHKKGAFTGAVRDHEGVFQAAHEGTLFLDEIEATSPAMQAKLLRAIQTGEIKPVGDNATRKVNVRLVTATNQDLQVLVQQGVFREDLYYRIHVFPITIPPLRDRRDDIPVLVEFFLDRLSSQTGKSVRVVDPAALDLLMQYPWPGNVRELENEIERAHVLTGEGGSISIRCLSHRITSSVEQLITGRQDATPVTIKGAVDELEKRMIVEALELTEGNRSLAAKRLGLSRQGLLNKIYKFELRTS